MKERPIIFTAESVRALLSGAKTQTRRLVKPQPSAGVRRSPFVPSGLEDGHGRGIRIPWYVGDRLWVRETWAQIYDVAPFDDGDPSHIEFRADGDPERLPGEWPSEERDDPECPRWRSPWFLKRKDSRIDLEITDVRVQRLQNITEEDARAEGTPGDHSVHWPDGDPGTIYDAHKRCFANAWDRINGKRASWASNPWAWTLTFRRVGP